MFTIFQKFKAAVENHSAKLIKNLRSDNGTEYASHEFEAFFTKVRHPSSINSHLYTSKNSVSERKNRSVMNMSRCLLFEKEMAKQLWAEVVNTSVYL